MFLEMVQNLGYTIFAVSTGSKRAELSRWNSMFLIPKMTFYLVEILRNFRIMVVLLSHAR